MSYSMETQKNSEKMACAGITRADENRLFWRIQTGQVKMSIFAKDDEDGDGEEDGQRFVAVAGGLEENGFTVNLVNDQNHRVQTISVDFDLIETIRQFSLLVAAFADAEHNIRIWFFDNEDPNGDFICDILWGEDGNRYAKVSAAPRLMFPAQPKESKASNN